MRRSGTIAASNDRPYIALADEEALVIFRVDSALTLKCFAFIPRLCASDLDLHLKLLGLDISDCDCE